MQFLKWILKVVKDSYRTLLYAPQRGYELPEDIKTLFLRKMNREITENFQPDQVVDALGFKDSLRLAYRLLYYSKLDADLQCYAVQLICKVKDMHKEEWGQDWRFEAFLGNAYEVVVYDDSDYEKRYEAYLTAYQKATPPPPELMIAFARCIEAPGFSPITFETAMDLAKKALEQGPYANAAGVMCLIYSAKGMDAELQHWLRIQDELVKNGKELLPLEPAFVREGCK